MYLQEILEVGIGLVFVWLILSVAAMQLLEWVRTILQTRSKNLEENIRKMLADPGLAEQFYEHPLVRGLSPKNRNPSYIPSQQFAQVLFDVISTAGTEASMLRRGLVSIKTELEENAKNKSIDKEKHKAANEVLNTLTLLAQKAVSTETGSAIANAALKDLKTQIDTLTKNDPLLQPRVDKMLNKVNADLTQFQSDAKKVKKSRSETLDQLRRGSIALTTLSPELNKTVSTLISGLEERAAAGEDAIAAARKNIANWFDNSMERLSGTFKRNAQWWTLAIGLIFAAALNVDSIQIANILWREPAVRAAFTERAKTFTLPASDIAADPQKATDEFRKNFEGLNIPIGWTFEKVNLEIVPVGSETKPQECKFNPVGLQDVFCFAKKNIGFLRPVGTEEKTNGWNWFGLKLLGIFISALATVQGAPFWFEMLNKLINIRGSGAKPPTAKEDEKSTSG